MFFQLLRDELDSNTIDPDVDEDTIPDETRDFNEIENQNNQSHCVYGEYIFVQKTKA